MFSRAGNQSRYVYPNLWLHTFFYIRHFVTVVASVLREIMGRQGDLLTPVAVSVCVVTSRDSKIVIATTIGRGTTHPTLIVEILVIVNISVNK